MATKAMTAFQRGAISEDARDFLVGWARETLRREPRPPEYSFLRHRFDASSVGVSRNPNPHQHGAPRPINILRPDGEPIQVSWRDIRRKKYNEIMMKKSKKRLKEDDCQMSFLITFQR